MGAMERLRDLVNERVTIFLQQTWALSNESLLDRRSLRRSANDR